MCPQLRNDDSDRSLEYFQIVQGIVQEVGGVSRMMELVYFTKWPGVLPMLQAVSAFRVRDRNRFTAFLMRGAGRTITITEKESDTITLHIETAEQALRKSA
jgi:hypothetical protein